MILTKSEVENIIPQKSPMVMVGALLSVDTKQVITEFVVPENHILLENSILNRTALIENMAQTAAVKAGYIAKTENKKPLTGLIGAIKNFEIFDTVKAGDILKTTIETTHEIFNASIIQGEIFCKNKRIAKGELKIFLIDQPSQ